MCGRKVSAFPRRDLQTQLRGRPFLAMQALWWFPLPARRQRLSRTWRFPEPPIFSPAPVLSDCLFVSIHILLWVCLFHIWQKWTTGGLGQLRLRIRLLSGLVLLLSGLLLLRTSWLSPFQVVVHDVYGGDYVCYFAFL